MARPNEEVAALLQEHADLISITGGDSFKVRVYEKASRSIAGYPDDVSCMDTTELRAIPNVGRSIADKVVEYFQSGSIHALAELRTRIPSGVRHLMEIPTLGPKRAMELYERLHVASVDQLREAIDSGALRDLKGFGEKSEDNLRRGISLLERSGERVQLGVASGIAEDIVGELTATRGCERCAYAGSLRRMRETVGDLDVLAAAEDSGRLMTTFVRSPAVADVIAHGTTKSSIRTSKGVQVDLRVVPLRAWGAALLYFTGSKAHNIRLRESAVRAKLKLSEYGLFDVETDELIVSETEEDVYTRLGLPWIPPTLREDRGEVEAARENRLPDLVTERAIRGDLHTHTNLTDGTASLEEMVEAAARRGYAYFAITDHAPNLYMQRMSDEKMLAQRARVRELDGRHARMRLLHGTELNLDPDGDVDWPAEFLADFDLCVASIHSHFTQSRRDATRRLVRACENPYVNLIGHPSARLIGRRDPVDADWDEVFRACARTGTALEINAFPDRIDLSDQLVLRARRHGVKFAVNTDSHAVSHLDNLRFGVGTAQRGWLTNDDVINTWPLRRLRSFLRKPAAAATPRSGRARRSQRR